MSLVGWAGVVVGLLVAVGLAYTLLEWWRERNGE